MVRGADHTTEPLTASAGHGAHEGHDAASLQREPRRPIRKAPARRPFANLPTLERVVADLTKRASVQPFAALYCLGDLGGYAAQPNAVQEMIMAQYRTGRSHDDNPWCAWARSRGATPYPTPGGAVYWA